MIITFATIWLLFDGFWMRRLSANCHDVVIQQCRPLARLTDSWGRLARFMAACFQLIRFESN